MALPLPSPFSVSEDAAQRAMERQILTLLHRATKPDALATMPLMRAICRATATPNALDALDRVVRDALDGRDPSAVMRREIIFASDFNRLVTNAQLAARNGISRRHFQRRRAQAITAIARFARNLLARKFRAGRGKRQTGRRASRFLRAARRRRLAIQTRDGGIRACSRPGSRAGDALHRRQSRAARDNRSGARLGAKVSG